MASSSNTFNSNDGKVLSWKIHWGNVRNSLKDEQEFEAQKELYGVFNKPPNYTPESADSILTPFNMIVEINRDNNDNKNMKSNEKSKKTTTVQNLLVEWE